MSERPCFFAKPVNPREKGCKKPAKKRVILGRGLTIDVCEDHVIGYMGMGYKIIDLEEVKASESG